jgi:TonB family protein
MTIFFLKPMISHDSPNFATNLSSRPERSVVEGPAVNAISVPESGGIPIHTSWVKSLIRGWLAAGILSSFLPCPASAMRFSAIGVATGSHLQESGATLGKFHVPPEKMAGLCVTMVSPTYPHAAEDLQKESAVVVQVVISKAGRVSPMRVVSGSPLLEAEAMNAVRLWRYKPFVRDNEPIDVTTEIQVNFEPGKPGGLVSHPNN